MSKIYRGVAPSNDQPPSKYEIMLNKYKAKKEISERQELSENSPIKAGGTFGKENFSLNNQTNMTNRSLSPATG